MPYEKKVLLYVTLTVQKNNFHLFHFTQNLCHIYTYVSCYVQHSGHSKDLEFCLTLDSAGFFLLFLFLVFFLHSLTNVIKQVFSRNILVYRRKQSIFRNIFNVCIKSLILNILLNIFISESKYLVFLVVRQLAIKIPM